MRNVDYSEVLSFSGGEKRQFKLSCLKKKGPRGGRNVISKLRIKGLIQVDTNGATTITAGGWSRVLDQLRVTGPQGEFINVNGPELRLMHFFEAGRDAYPDPALLAVSQTNATRQIEWILDCAPVNRSKRRWDYAIPCDHLLAVGDNAIELKAAAAADIGTGAGTTLDSLTLQLIFETREEADIQDHVWREIRSVAQNQLTDFELPVSGGLVRSCTAYKYLDHITGMTDMSSTTAVMVTALGIDSVDPEYLRDALLDEGGHDRTSTSDPWVQTTERVIPIFWASAGEKLTDMPRHGQKLGIRLIGNSVANVSLLYEVIYEQTEKSTQVEQALAAELGLKQRFVKSEGKTRRTAADWPGLFKFMPAKLAA